MKKIKIIVLIVVVLSLIGATKGFTAEEDSRNVFTGNLESDNLDISTEVSGIIKAIHIKEGETVKVGDIIAEIDVTELELERNRLEANLKGSEAGFSKVKVGPKDMEIEKARTQIRQQQSNVSAISEEYKFVEDQHKIKIELYESAAISKSELDKSTTQLVTAKEKLSAANEQLTYLNDQLSILNDGATDEELTISQSQYESALASLAVLEHKISKSNVYAKSNGTAKAVNFQVGEFVPQYSKIATLEDVNNIWVQIFIPEKELHRVNVGDSVKLRNTYDEGEYEGIVVYISNSGEFTPKNTESKESRQEIVFKVKIALPEGTASLKAGMLVDIVLGDGNDV